LIVNSYANNDNPFLLYKFIALFLLHFLINRNDRHRPVPDTVMSKSSFGTNTYLYCWCNPGQGVT